MSDKREEIKAAFDAGWRMCAEWTKREDMKFDMDSPEYELERAVRLGLAISSADGWALKP